MGREKEGGKGKGGRWEKEGERRGGATHKCMNRNPSILVTPLFTRPVESGVLIQYSCC